MSDRSRRARRWLARFALVAFGFGLALASLEIAVRARWQPGNIEAPPRNPLLDDLPRLRTVAELAQPNVRGLYAGVIHRTNSAGFRGREFPLLKPPHTFRIVVTGDSVTMGVGVRERAIYTAVLERRLRAESAGTNVEILNVGLAGANAEAALNRLRMIGLPRAPDLIVYGFTINDIEGPHYRVRAPEDREAFGMSRIRFHESPSLALRLVWPRWIGIRDALLPMRGSYAYELQDNYFHNPPAWGDFTEALSELATIGSDAGACVLVLIHPHLFTLNVLHPFADTYERVADAARASDLFAVPTFDYVQGYSESDLHVNPIDSHPNALGHELLANALYDGIRTLPERCRVPAATNAAR